MQNQLAPTCKYSILHRFYIEIVLSFRNDELIRNREEQVDIEEKIKLIGFGVSVDVLQKLYSEGYFNIYDGLCGFATIAQSEAPSKTE